MSQPAYLEGTTTPQSQMVIVATDYLDNRRHLPSHDWGPFGKYEYLGAGTPFQKKAAARIRPVNDLDQIAYYHDEQYSWLTQHSIAGVGGMITSPAKGIADLGAGAAMEVAAINPWSDLSMGERVLAFVAGTALSLQGVLRLNPLTWGPMAMLDSVFYS